MQKYKKPKKWVFRKNNYVIVFRWGITANEKIAPYNTAIIQQYSFSADQFNFIREGGNYFNLPQYDKAVCMDCPKSGNSGDNKCYTAKFLQLKSFHTMLKHIMKTYPTFESIPILDKIPVDLLFYANDEYIRWGTYGEPTLVPYKWVNQLCDVAKNWTGYTHQWKKAENYLFSDFFMASCEGNEMAALERGWRVFNIVRKYNVENFHCPASDEMNRRSYCMKCGLCSGLSGKGKINLINIVEH